MKKRIFVFTMMCLCTNFLWSQTTIGDLLKVITSSTNNETVQTIGNTVSDIVSQAVTGTASFDLTGTWMYNGCAYAMQSDNALTNLATNATSSLLEGRIDNALSKIGIKKGSTTFTFNSDGSFSIPAGKINLSGTWTKEGDKVKLQFGKLMKLLTMDGTLVAEESDCKILFESGKFMDFLTTALTAVSAKTKDVTKASKIASTMKNLKIGFKLTKN